MITAQQALARLKEGNARFVEKLSANEDTCMVNRPELVAEQSPFAIILGCSDARVPAELYSIRAWATYLLSAWQEISLHRLALAALSLPH